MKTMLVVKLRQRAKTVREVHHLLIRKRAAEEAEIFLSK